MGQFICYHPPEETFYENSKVTLYVVDLYVVNLVPIQPLKPQHANKNTRLTPLQVTKT